MIAIEHQLVCVVIAMSGFPFAMVQLEKSAGLLGLNTHINVILDRIIE